MILFSWNSQLFTNDVKQNKTDQNKMITIKHKYFLFDHLNISSIPRQRISILLIVHSKLWTHQFHFELCGEMIANQPYYSLQDYGCCRQKHQLKYFIFVIITHWVSWANDTRECLLRIWLIQHTITPTINVCYTTFQKDDYIIYISSSDNWYLFALPKQLGP